MFSGVHAGGDDPSGQCSSHQAPHVMNPQNNANGSVNSPPFPYRSPPSTVYLPHPPGFPKPMRRHSNSPSNNHFQKNYIRSNSDSTFPMPPIGFYPNRPYGPRIPFPNYPNNFRPMVPPPPGMFPNMVPFGHPDFMMPPGQFPPVPPMPTYYPFPLPYGHPVPVPVPLFNNMPPPYIPMPMGVQQFPMRPPVTSFYPTPLNARPYLVPQPSQPDEYIFPKKEPTSSKIESKFNPQAPPFEPRVPAQVNIQPVKMSASWTELQQILLERVNGVKNSSRSNSVSRRYVPVKHKLSINDPNRFFTRKLRVPIRPYYKAVNSPCPKFFANMFKELLTKSGIFNTSSKDGDNWVFSSNTPFFNLQPNYHPLGLVNADNFYEFFNQQMTFLFQLLEKHPFAHRRRTINSRTFLEEFIVRCSEDKALYRLFVALVASFLPAARMSPSPTLGRSMASPSVNTRALITPGLPPPEDTGLLTLPHGETVPLPDTDKKHKFNYMDVLVSTGEYDYVNNFPPESENGGDHPTSNINIVKKIGLPGFPLPVEENPNRVHTTTGGLETEHYVMTDEEAALKKERNNNYTTLQLSGGITRISPTIYTLEFLTALHLSNNRIVTVSKKILNLKNLKILDLSNNLLCYLPPTIAKIGLEELYVQNNALHNLPNEIGSMNTLRIIKAENNPLVPDIQQFFNGKRPTMEIMPFLKCRLSGLPPKAQRTLCEIKPDMAPKYPKFTALCYNILCKHYAGPSHYPWCPVWALDWSYRKPQILAEIEKYSADIMAFQEMDGEEFFYTFKPRFIKLGYHGVYYSKTRARSMGKDHHTVDGCAIFWKSDKFDLDDHAGIDMCSNPIESVNQLPLSYIGHTPSMRETPNTIMINRMMPRDNIGLVVRLIPKMLFYDSVRGNASAERQQRNSVPIVVATTHFHWDPDHCDVKSIQALSFVQGVRKAVNDLMVRGNFRIEQIPVLILGDFNSLPGSAVTDYVGNNRVRKDHPEFKDFVNIDLSRFACSSDRFYYRHSLNLANVLERKNYEYTNYTSKFTGAIDHMFVTPDTIRTIRVLDPIPMSWLKANNIEGFPNAHTPSDHIPLYSEFNLVDPDDVTQALLYRDAEEVMAQQLSNAEFHAQFTSRLGRQVILP